MKNFTVYKPNAGASIYARIHNPVDNTAWDDVTKTMELAAGTTTADTLIEVAWDATLHKYRLPVPALLPVDKEYDIIFYTSQNEAEVHLGRRVLNTALRGFIQSGQFNIPSWI